MLLPYFAYGLVIILIFYSNSPKAIYLNIQRLIIGGENLQGPLGVLWFISVLLVTQLVMGFISRYNIYIQLSIITLFYIVGHIIAMTSLSQIELPWKLSAVTGALFYYSMGYYLKNYIVKYVHNFKLIIPIFIFLIAFTFLYITLDFAFSINLKTDVFDSLILDAIIPILISFLICSLSFFLSKVKVFNFLKWLGRNSITIMYLHLPINIIIMRLLKSDYHDLLFVLFGVFISLAFGLILSKIKFTKHLFISPNISKNY
ncbi:acyltransferase family protein [Staphylococcus massiliensis]|uniref:acyltransferase family protein n=1 Tax=Staphylococcus massiliensis TaxID=555791 RepID=UPI003BB1DA62